ncbi:hypothetical protein SAY87_027032 [Trapa incisa]|uniref:Uncharacterized protein n=1 Tax=Trapa incisa TaxID=236973 RepID=A0AAN7GYP8_9MYRT|nr:hypothetical protein SAY87_027032 [Trapa incisa]
MIATGKSLTVIQVSETPTEKPGVESRMFKHLLNQGNTKNCSLESSRSKLLPEKPTLALQLVLPLGIHCCWYIVKRDVMTVALS